jgi:hypothetical protein
MESQSIHPRVNVYFRTIDFESPLIVWLDSSARLFHLSSMKPIFGATAQPCTVPDPGLQAEYSHLSDECQFLGHSLNLLLFIRNRLRIHLASFQQSDQLDIAPLNVLVSAKLVPFLNGSARFFFTLYESSTPSLLSTYFDKMLCDIGDSHFEWQRGPDNLALDGIEYVVRDVTGPVQVSCVLYPDFPVPYFVVPDQLRAITGTNVDHFAAILKKVLRHAAFEKQIVGDEFLADWLQPGGEASVKLERLPFLLQSMLLPVAPINLSFVLKPDGSRFNVQLALPDFSQIHPSVPVAPTDFTAVLTKFASEKERVDFLAAIARNPYEALEAEIAGHATMCELTDETSEKGPTLVIDAMNPARRSTPFYWQPWVADYIPRFLEENRMIHRRYPSKK